MDLSGTVDGRFRITGKLGAGGMGEVYRAHDERLRRDVALKVLPAGLASDAERLVRFEHEARAAAALNHPNILALHDLGYHDGAPYLVTELLEGETLRSRLAAGALPVRVAVELAVHLAQGLAAAHAKGIAHRDLKPDNVFVTTDGGLKILDFGLASLMAEREEPAGPDDAPTRKDLTQPGVVLGTVGYMAPEQVRGARVDQRADIFSFGCVLYEMLTGKRAFARATTVDTLSAILRDEPTPVVTVRAEVSPALSLLLGRCLSKRPEDRFSSAHDVALALQAAVSDAGVGTAPTVVAVGPRRRRAVLLRLVGAGLVLAAVAFVWMGSGRRGSGRQAALDAKKVLVGPFENMTGERALDPVGHMVTEAISQGLVELGGVEVVSAPPGAPGGAGRDGDAALRTAARAAGAGTLVSGSYYLSGEGLDLRGRVSDVASGKLLYALKPETGPRDAPADAVERVRQRVMGAVVLHSGEAPALGGITVPPLYSAYQELLAGSRAMGVDSKAVVAHLEKAAAIDPDFWHPQLRLLAFYRGVGDTAKLDALKRRLQDNQDRFGPADLIIFQYYEAQLAGRTLEAYRKTRELLALAPDDFTYKFGAANPALVLNRPREALECLGDLEKMDWKTFGHWMQGTWLFGVAAFSHHLLGEHEAELRVAELGLRIYPDMLNVRGDKVRALAALGRVAELDRTITEGLAIRSRTESPGDVLLIAAEELLKPGG